MALIFGVEVEFHVENDPRPDSVFETPYPILQSHIREDPQGNLHQRHGDMVREIHTLTEGEVQVGYDLTASFGDSVWEGWELSSLPLSIEDTLRVWRKVYESRAKTYLNADPDIARRRYAPAHHSCGMHIHLSGDDITEGAIVNMSRIVNSPDSREFITHVAGRYNTRFCRIVHPADAFLRCLFHSPGCASEGKIDRTDIPRNAGRFAFQPGRNLCCDNADLLAHYVHNMEVSRHSAINYVPNPNTGAIEFRLFAAPNDYARAAANVEFAHALVTYSKDNNESEAPDFCAWLEEDRQRRRQYSHLFRHLREAAFVRGLIPIR